MRVDLLLADRRCYTYEAYAAKHVTQCLRQAKIDFQSIYLSDGTLQDYFFYAQNSPPEWSLSFVNLTPHQKPLCDVLDIPHFFWLEGSFAHAVHFLQSTCGRVGVPSLTFCQNLSAHNVFFLPHGVEEHIPAVNKAFDVVFFAGLQDLSFLERTWKELFSPAEIAKIKKGVQDGDPLGARSHFFYVEQYLKAQRTLQTVSAFKDVKLDLFGEHAGNNWLVQLPQTIHLHTILPFTEHFEVLKQSKIALLEPSSQWYWPAIAAGCLPLPADAEEVNYYLAHPAEREMSLALLKTGLPEHTWERQTKRLIEIMARG